MNKGNTQHGHCRRGNVSAEYQAWNSMVKRCTNKNCKAWKNYGGRGIKVCERWMKFENFLADMGERPKGMSLDRHPNNDGNYCKENCRWTTAKEQSKNRRNTLKITFQGKTQCAKDWAIQFEIRVSTLTKRLSLGWSPERALTEPIQIHRTK